MSLFIHTFSRLFSLSLICLLVSPGLSGVFGCHFVVGALAVVASPEGFMKGAGQFWVSDLCEVPGESVIQGL